MSYEKQTWETGQVITAEKLNHMEDGIGGGILVVSEIETQEGSKYRYSLSSTWQQILDATIAIVKTQAYDQAWYMNGFVTELDASSGEYTVKTSNGTWKTDSPNGYPSFLE